MAIHIKKDGTEQSGLVDDDIVQPFRLEKSGVRGRMVRLGSVLDDIMQRHDYPPPVTSLLSEVLTLCLLLSSMFKYEGIFSLQVKGDGAIHTLVADVTSKGMVRAYARFDSEAVKKMSRSKKDKNNHYYLLGNGHIAFTVDPWDDKSQYQGIVELKGKSIVDAVQHYLTQSEQIKTSFKLAVHPQDRHWRTGGIMIQQLPDKNAGKSNSVPDVEDWTRTVMLLSTCSEGEILSTMLHSADILYRLFHEDGVRITSPTHIHFGCRCTSERVSDILRTIPRREIEEICEKEGKVIIKCEFCSEEYTLSASQLDGIYKEEKS